MCRIAWAIITDDGIPVRQQKTGKEMFIPMLPALRVELGLAPKRALTVLSNRIGRALQPAVFASWVATFARANGVHLVPHGLRKNAVNALLEAGCSTAEVSAITGQSLSIVEHYAKQRNQRRIATTAAAKWGEHEAGTGKLLRIGKTGGVRD